MTRSLALVLFVAATACGSNRPEIPPELLATGGNGGSGTYPAGPYGKDKGEVAENFLFPQVWTNPTAQGHDAAALAPASLSDFYNPTGGTDGELLLLNAGAMWCNPCKAEHGGSASSPSLNDHFDELSPKGFRLLALLIENAKGDTATPADLGAWTQAYETRFPMGLDADFQMQRYGTIGGLPINVLIDLRSMKILARVTGDPAAIWPTVKAELDARAQ
ncbi:MAG: TlpA family protein disulfide reductase [Polyangiaceae bacterium]|nr:TlpA family protein disulfide reductase [Polyangiaceae bacterium]